MNKCIIGEMKKYRYEIISYICNVQTYADINNLDHLFLPKL